MEECPCWAEIFKQFHRQHETLIWICNLNIDLWNLFNAELSAQNPRKALEEFETRRHNNSTTALMNTNSFISQ